MGKQDKQPPVQDSRFAAMHTDPRFQRFPKAKQRVEIDKRFSGMFEDPEFQTRAVVDKRGRKIQKQHKHDDLKRYYRLKDEEEWGTDRPNSKATTLDASASLLSKHQPQKAPHQQQQTDSNTGKKQLHKRASTNKPEAQTGKPSKKEQLKKQAELQPAEQGSEQLTDDQAAGLVSCGTGEDESSDEQGSGSDTEQAESSETGSEDALAQERWARARGLIDGVSSGDDSDEEEGMEYDSADEPLTDEEPNDALELDPEEWGVGAMAANPAEEVPVMEATRRLAVVDLDWGAVKAVDILAVLRSFLPKGGELLRVTVYPSDYGLQKMAEEAALGPRGIFKTNNQSNNAEHEDDEKEVDPRRVRMYELSKLRYYYAIVECDTVATSLHIYNECDGLEFERSSCKFDLRFVPDEQSFEGRQVRDTAMSVPADYEPPTHFNTSLQHTDPQLTWDAEDQTRKKALSKRLKEDEIKDGDFMAYLGSDDDDDQDGDDADPEAIRQRYRALLLSGDKDDAPVDRKGGKSWGGDDGDAEDSGSDEREEGQAERTRIRGRDGVDMEVTFMPGLENMGKKLLEKKRDAQAREGETVWEAYLRKKKEKRALKKKQGKHARDSSESEDSEDEIQIRKASKKEQNAQSIANGHANGDQDDDPFNDPFFQDTGDFPEDIPSSDEDIGTRKKGAKHADKLPKKGDIPQKKADKQKTDQEKAELELLMMDDSALRHAAHGVRVQPLPHAHDAAASMQPGKKLSKKEKRALKKEMKRKQRAGSDEEDIGGDDDGGFAVNLEDPRFAQMFQDPSFALDPTHPQFAKNKSAEVLAKEVAKRRSHQLVEPQQAAHGASSSKGHHTQRQQQQPEIHKQESRAAHGPNGTDAGLEKSELRAMVAKLKRKSESLQQKEQAQRAKMMEGGGGGSKAKKQKF